MMKRAKGVTLAEIAEVTNWQKHTIRGFVSILGKPGAARTSNRRGMRSVSGSTKSASKLAGNRASKRRLRSTSLGAAFLLVRASVLPGCVMHLVSCLQLRPHAKLSF